MYFPVQGGTRRYNEVQGGTWVIQGTVQEGTRQYVLVCTGMYLYVLPGTRRYMEVHQNTRRYMLVQRTVQEGTRQYVLVCTGMYWYVPISTVQPGYAALPVLLDSLL